MKQVNLLHNTNLKPLLDTIVGVYGLPFMLF